MKTMNEINEGPQPWIDPALEARIVAGVLGETSAFEAAELDRVLTENPELAIFKRRIQAVHALVGVATRREQPKIQLSPTRRQQLLDKLGARPRVPKKKVFVLPRPFWWSSRNLIAVAASLVIGAIAVTFFGTMVVFQARQAPPDFEGESGGFAEYGNAPAAGNFAMNAAPAAGVTVNVPTPSSAPMPPMSRPVNTVSTTAASTAPMAHMSSTAIAGVGGAIAANGISATRAAVSETKPSIVQQPQEMARLERADRSAVRKAAPELQNRLLDADQYVAGEKAKEELAEAPAQTAALGVETGGPVDRMPSLESSNVRNREPAAVSSPDKVGPDSAGPSSKSEFSVREAGDGLTGAQASAIKAFTGGWGKGSGSGTGARGGGAKDEGRNQAAQDASDSNARNGAPVPVELAKNKAASSDMEEKERILNQPGKPGFVTSPATSDAGFVDMRGFPPGTEVRKAAKMDADKKGPDENGADLSGVEQASRLLFSPQAGSRDGRPTSQAPLKLEPLGSGNKRPAAPALGDLPLAGRAFSPTSAKDSAHAFQTETQAAKQPFSTFSLHVSDVSFQLAKDALARGAMPDPDRIRAEEFYNAFDYGDPAPATGEEVACRIEQCAHPFLQQRDLVRIALKVAAAGRAAGQPLRLTILLDTSGSMEREDRAASVRRALEILATLLGPNDRVTLIGFARTPRLLAEQVPGDQVNKLVEIAAHTPSEGGTNLELALGLASELALKQKLPSAQNRIVLLTDGAANLGDANPVRLARQIEKTRQQGISFDACGVGANGLNDEILEALTRKGDGRYYFLNRPEDADANFARQLAGAFHPAAENVKVQVVFNPARVSQYRLIGFEKHLLKKEDFRNDKIQAAELSAEEAGVAVYQVQTLPEGDGELGEVFVRFRDPANGQMIEHSWTMPYDAKAPAFNKAAPSMQLAVTSALLAEKLRGDSQVDLNTLAPVITNLRGQYPHQAKVADLIRMFERMRQ